MVAVRIISGRLLFVVGLGFQYLVASQMHCTELTQQLKMLRNLVADMACKTGEEVSNSGSWCLLQDEKKEVAPGFPLAKNHVPADAGLASLFQTLFSNYSVLDMGAGIGQYGHYYRQNAVKGAVKYTGVDGALNVETFTKNFVRWVDLTVPMPRDIRLHDWVTCLEVGEHIPAEFEHLLFENIFKRNRCGVALSWAVPGQGGHGHINEKNNDAVINIMIQNGYNLHDDITKAGRTVASYYWFRNSFMFFSKNDASEFCKLPDVNSFESQTFSSL